MQPSELVASPLSERLQTRMNRMRKALAIDPKLKTKAQYKSMPNELTGYATPEKPIVNINPKRGYIEQPSNVGRLSESPYTMAHELQHTYQDYTQDPSLNFKDPGKNTYSTHPTTNNPYELMNKSHPSMAESPENLYEALRNTRIKNMKAMAKQMADEGADPRVDVEALDRYHAERVPKEKKYYWEQPET